MPIEESYNPYEQAREVIESLGETDSGKEFERHVIDSKKKKFHEFDMGEHHRLLNRDLFNYIDKLNLELNEREWIEDCILDGDYRGIAEVLAKEIERNDDPEDGAAKRSRANELLDRIRSKDFQQYLIKFRERE